MDRIIVPGLVLGARVGVSEKERAAAQDVVVEVELRLDLRRAGAADDLTATVDYEEICDVVERLVEARAFHLIEALAHAAADALVQRFPVQEARVRVRKPAALGARGVPYAEVEVCRSRDG